MQRTWGWGRVQKKKKKKKGVAGSSSSHCLPATVLQRREGGPCTPPLPQAQVQATPSPQRCHTQLFPSGGGGANSLQCLAAVPSYPLPPLPRFPLTLPLTASVGHGRGVSGGGSSDSSGSSGSSGGGDGGGRAVAVGTDGAGTLPWSGVAAAGAAPPLRVSPPPPLPACHSPWSAQARRGGYRRCGYRRCGWPAGPAGQWG